MYYKSINAENSKANERLFDVNKQISSGIKIQYASDNISIFTETMRLDNELVSLGQIKKSTANGYKMSNQSDVTMNEFSTSINRTRTLLLNAANGTNDATSLNSIAAELRGIESNLKSLANTSINGQYIFSGSAVDVKPINADGTYNGNALSISAFVGAGVQQAYNLSGASLFLGEESLVRREITTNVVQFPNVNTTLNGNTTMGDFMGVVPAGNLHNFYIRGAQSDGTAINKQIQLTNVDTVDSLLNAIGQAYGNTGTTQVVNVSMNQNGQIVVQDKLQGSSKLDFHMIGASDFDATDNADISAATNNISDLDIGSTDYATAQAAVNKLYIREFNVSSYTAAAGAPVIGGSLYDMTQFSVSGNKLSSSIPQIVKGSNAFATPSTKLSEVADLSQGTAGTLAGTQLTLSGTDINGNAFNAQIDFNSNVLPATGSTFTVGGNTYNIFDMGNPRAAVNADDMTYQQLMDVMNMVTTLSLPPVAATATQYDNAILTSNVMGQTSLSYDGKLQFNDLQNATTKATIALHDSNSGDFTAGNASVLTFNNNNALTVRDPKTDFFKTFNEMITAVEEYKIYPNSANGNARTVGIENAIAMMDDLQNHVLKSHSLVGAQSNTLDTSLQRTTLLEVSTMTLRSSVIDTDMAEASLQLSQLTLNFQAMLSTVGKISQLSLVNYL